MAALKENIASKEQNAFTGRFFFKLKKYKPG